jgi:hypothetical protein
LDIVHLTSINVQKKILKNPVFKSTHFFSRCILMYDIYATCETDGRTVGHWYTIIRQKGGLPPLDPPIYFLGDDHLICFGGWAITQFALTFLIMDQHF